MDFLRWIWYSKNFLYRNGHVDNNLLCREYRLSEVVTMARKSLSIFLECRVIKITKDKVDKPKWCHRSSYRDPAIFVLAECEV